MSPFLFVKATFISEDLEVTIGVFIDSGAIRRRNEMVDEMVWDEMVDEMS